MRWINSEFPAWPVCCVLRQMEAEGAWFLTKAACENLMDAQINTQRRQVAIQSLRCYNYSSFSLLNKHKGDFSFLFFFFILLPASYPSPLTAKIGNLALIAPSTLLRHNKCLSAWCNCVCRSWRAMEERDLGGGGLGSWKRFQRNAPDGATVHSGGQNVKFQDDSNLLSKCEKP